MTDPHLDERVDELLADLDRALTVEPSPAVAARARTRLEASTSGWPAWRWSLAVASVVVLAASAYLAWPQRSAVRSDSVQIVSGAPGTRGSQPPAQLPSQAAPGATTPAIRHARAQAAEPRGARPATPDVREPDVLVSPTQRIALEQLAVAVRDGRLTAAAMAAANQPVVHQPLIVPSVVIAPFEADVLPAIGTSVTVGTEGNTSRRRSAS